MMYGLALRTMGGGTNTPPMVYGLLRMANPPLGALDAVRDAHPRRVGGTFSATNTYLYNMP